MYTKSMYLNRKLCEDIMVHPAAAENPNLFGIEVELEGMKVKTDKEAIMAFWEAHKDGSLRVNLPGAECIEYVFKQPYDLNQTGDALIALFDHLNSKDVEVFQSYRTSIHVHVSYALETMRTIYNAMVLSIIFDELFTSQNGDHRIGNNFCLRAKDAQGQIDEIIKSTEIAGNYFHVNNNNRYSSINFVSLKKFGTIEYRSLECTTDLNRVMHWIETLNRIRRVARSFDNPKEIIGFFSRMSPKAFLHFCLGAYASKYEEVEGFDEMLVDGMRLAQDLAFCSTWVLKEKEDEPKPKPKPRVPKIPPMGDQFEQQLVAMAAHHEMLMQNAPQAMQGAPQPNPWWGGGIPQPGQPQPAVVFHEDEVDEILFDMENDD